MKTAREKKSTREKNSKIQPENKKNLTEKKMKILPEKMQKVTEKKSKQMQKVKKNKKTKS